ITIGEDFLPVLADVAGALAKVVSAVGELPDPVRKIGTGFTVAATGVALLAGGFLLLLPRIVATKAAMAQLNISAGKLGRVGGALGAITAVTMGLDYMWQAAKHAGDGWREMNDEISAGGMTGAR